METASISAAPTNRTHQSDARIAILPGLDHSSHFAYHSLPLVNRNFLDLAARSASNTDSKWVDRYLPGLINNFLKKLDNCIQISPHQLSQPAQAATEVFDLRSYRPDLGFVILTNGENRRNGPIDKICSLTISNKSFILDADAREALELCTTHLSGIEIEFDTSRMPDVSKITDWDDSYELEDQKLYVQLVYPLMQKAIEMVGKRPWGNPQQGCLIDLFGGDGALLHNILSSQNPDANWVKDRSCILIDGNANRIEKATKKLSDFGNAKVVHAYVDEETPLTQLAGERPAFVLASGALTRGVTTRQEATTIAENVFENLIPGGLFILSGRTALQLGALDFHSIGFEVLNRSMPPRFFKLDDNPYCNVGCQLYILRKPYEFKR